MYLPLPQRTGEKQNNFCLYVLRSNYLNYSCKFTLDPIITLTNWSFFIIMLLTKLSVKCITIIILNNKATTTNHRDKSINTRKQDIDIIITTIISVHMYARTVIEGSLCD